VENAVTGERLLFLLKPGELALKKGNKAAFERALLRNLAALLRGTGARVRTRGGHAGGRYFVEAPVEAKAAVEEALGRLFGIAGWALARQAEKTVEAVTAAAVSEARADLEAETAAPVTSFKIEARRTDKSFPLDSYGIGRAAGDAVTAACPGLRVNVHNPGLTINIEIRERAYVYGRSTPGLRGLPVGTAGRGLLLLSGGIDSPAAGYLMLSRGMGLDAVYFHAFPYTSEEARQKVVTLARILSRYSLGTRLFTIGFTDVETRIKDRAPEAWATVLLRMAMMEAAAAMARERRYKALVTGESLAQVASQTVENLAVTGSRAGSLPVLRPLIGLDKEAITLLSQRIGTYETSILPYADCCTLFSPPHPVLRAGLSEAEALYAGLELGPLIEAALCDRRTDQDA